MASPHEVLGVDPNADAETVERRYRELVKEVHPDAGGSAEEFKRVRDAYRAIVEGDGGAGTAAGAGAGGASESGDGSPSTGPGSAADRTGGRGGSSTAGGRSERRSGGESYTAAGRRRRTDDGAYTGHGRGSRASNGQGRRRDGGTATAGSAGTAAGAAGQGRARRDAGTGEGGSGVARRAFLYGIPSLLGLGALAHYEGVFDELLGQGAAEEGPAREDTVAREVSPDDLFPVTFQASAGSTVRFTVEGADTSDWVKVYTQSEYESVASHWEETGEFDEGNPLRTVLTENGYAAELPEDGTYVILVKLWSGPPDDPREPRTVEVSYEVSS